MKSRKEREDKEAYIGTRMRTCYNCIAKYNTLILGSCRIEEPSCLFFTNLYKYRSLSSRTSTYAGSTSVRWVEILFRLDL